MEAVEIKAVERLGKGKGAARKERAKGLVPAVVYSGGAEPVHFAFAPDSFQKALVLGAGRNSVFKLDLSGLGKDSTLAIVKEIQRPPTSDKYLHVDFLAVQERGKVVVTVPLEFDGVPVGVKMGGKLKRHLRTVELRCEVARIPRSVKVDISPLEGGQKLMLSSLEVPEGSELVYRVDQPIVSVSGGSATSSEEEASEEQPA